MFQYASYNITHKETLPAVHEELTEPAEITASGGRTLFLWKMSTRRGTHSSFCSLCPSLQIFDQGTIWMFLGSKGKNATKRLMLDSNYWPSITTKAPPTHFSAQVIVNCQHISDIWRKIKTNDRHGENLRVNIAFGIHSHCQKQIRKLDR